MGLLAHEYAHLVHRDHLRGRLWLLTECCLQWLLAGDNRDTFNWLSLRTLAYRRQMELEADDLAFRMLREARLPTQGMVDFFKRGPSGQEARNFYEILATHPTDAKRVRHLEDLGAIPPIAPTSPLQASSWLALKHRAEELVQK